MPDSELPTHAIFLASHPDGLWRRNQQPPQATEEKALSLSDSRRFTCLEQPSWFLQRCEAVGCREKLGAAASSKTRRFHIRCEITHVLLVKCGEAYQGASDALWQV